MAKNAGNGSKIYSKKVLSVYDLFVLGFSNRWAWRCPTSAILEHYDRHISGNHLDVGVGTGYFLDHCEFPTDSPRIVLVDLNRNSLEVAAARLARYRPVTHVGDVFEPLRLDAGFDSIGLNYVLHCLPGQMAGKGTVFGHLKSVLNENGVIFGTTLLGEGVPRNFLAETLTRIYNSKGIFGNAHDTMADLERSLAVHFSDFDLWGIGCAAFFVGRK